MDLKDILNRRGDLSTFLVHLTREYNGHTPRENLERIIELGELRARNVFGMCAERQQELTDDARATQKVVCFSETPLEYTYMMVQEIQHRQFHFGPYGIAITKFMGRSNRINPVWYLDMTPGYEWLTHNLNRLVDRYIEDDCEDQDLAAIFPFMEQMGTWPANNSQKEFWWEREWRHVSNFELGSRFICLCPEDEIEDFQELLEEHDLHASCIDPRWSLEKIIAKLSGFRDSDIDIPQIGG